MDGRSQLPNQKTFRLEMTQKNTGGYAIDSETDKSRVEYEAKAIDDNGNEFAADPMFNPDKIPPDAVVTRIELDPKKVPSSEIIAITVAHWNPTVICIDIGNGQRIYIEIP